MRIHEVVDDRSQVQKILGTFVAAEVAHCLYSVFDLSIVPLNWIVIMLQSIFPARDCNAEMQRACSVEQFVECVAIVFESVRHERDELAFSDRLVFFVRGLA